MGWGGVGINLNWFQVVSTCWENLKRIKTLQVWDLIKLADYLTNQRDDIDFARIGITGESLGGSLAQDSYLIYTSNFNETQIL